MPESQQVRRTFVWMCGAACAALLLSAAIPVEAQQPLGSLKTEGTEVAGTVTVSGGRATIVNAGMVTTIAQPAEISLSRGGAVKVCGGSSVRISQPTMQVAHPPLLTALNRGAMEIHAGAEKSDVILTPDFRLELSDAAPLDLRVRLVANGDTCVENAGRDAPMIHVTEAFGTGAYFIRPGQRVLFEHGSLREVVDHESSSCGCPKPDAVVLAGNGKHGDGKVPEVVSANPFPEAVSQGLQQPTVPQAAPDQTHVQVATTLNYSGVTNAVSGPPGQTTTAGDVAVTPAAAASRPTAPTAATAPTPAQPVEAKPEAATAGTGTTTDAKVVDAAPPPAGPNPFRAIGRFFRHLFGGS